MARTLTETHWLTLAEPERLLDYLRRRRGLGRLKGARRKLRLLACGAARLVWDLLPDDRYRTAIETAERAADAEARRVALEAARADARGRKPGSIREYLSFTFEGLVAQFGWSSSNRDRHRVAANLAQAVAATGGGLTNTLHALRSAVELRILSTPPGAQKELADADHARLVRCVFGNPFRPLVVDPGWRNADVRGLAGAIYEERALEQLPILADALEDAGCTHDGALAHLRTESQHCRGCWVVDAVLGRGVEWK